MEKYFLSKRDDDFDSKLSPNYQDISKIHWTPVAVIDEVSCWLNTHASRTVLDIGSGVGKFCLTAAQNSTIQFTGVELRAKLHHQAIDLQKEMQINNATFLNADILTIPFYNFGAIYYYQPFCEHLCEADWIEQDQDFSVEQFHTYEAYVLDQLKNCNSGTLFISYCAHNIEMPECFMLEDMKFDGLLQLWIKK